MIKIAVADVLVLGLPMMTTVTMTTTMMTMMMTTKKTEMDGSGGVWDDSAGVSGLEISGNRFSRNRKRRRGRRGNVKQQKQLENKLTPPEAKWK
jgi:hypothetical protein